MAAERLTDEEYARQNGFTPGKAAGYEQQGLWLREDDGGGSWSVYPMRTVWVAAFFGPGQNVPFISKDFPTFRAAVGYILS